MSVKITARETGQWKELRRLLKLGQFNERARQGMSVATNINGAVVRREIRDNLRNATYSAHRAPNAALTIAIKRSTKPLVDTGQLFKSVTTSPIDWHSIEVGVLRGSPDADVAQVVHEGTTIEITKKMRDMFAMLAEASAGSIDPSRLTGRARDLWARMPGGWKALRPGTAAIRIPPRPFIREVVEDQRVIELCGANWLQALSRSLAGLPVTAAHLRRTV